LLGQNLRILEQFMHFNVQRSSNEYKSWMLTIPTRWKALVRNARHFVIFRVLLVVKYFVDAGVWDFFSRLKLVADCRHVGISDCI
jgi:hypothetical protein